MNWLRLLIVCLLLIFIADSVVARTLHVPEEYYLINQAFEAAEYGDTIQMASGTYLYSYILMKSGITVRGETGNPDDVIFDGNQTGRPIFRCYDLEIGSRIEGITLYNGGYYPQTTTPSGGMHVANSTLQVTDCVFRENRGPTCEGGAIYCEDSDLTLERCDFIQNKASYDQTYSCGGGAVSAFRSTITITACEFDRNDAHNDGPGGACQFNSCYIYIMNSRFTSNEAAHSGAIDNFQVESQTGSLYVSHSLFQDNWCIDGGGAITSVTDGCEIANCMFIDNYSSSNNREITVYALNPSIRNSTFVSTGSLSGYPRALINAPYDGTLLTIETCLFQIQPGERVLNCDANENVQFLCCNIYKVDGSEAWESCFADQFGVNNNISADPEFCGIPGSGNYYLQSDSPCATAQSSCGMLIGAWPVGCEATSTRDTSWSELKSLY